MSPFWLASTACLLALAQASDTAVPPSPGEVQATRYEQWLETRPGHISPFVWGQIHKERMMDPPAPANLLGLRAQAAGGPVVFGRFISVQANVDASGNDIIGDAANEPSIAVDPNNLNRMAIGWRQFDSTISNFRQAGYAYSADGGQTWTFPGVIEPGIFRSDPVLAADAFGNFYYSSLGHHPVTDEFEIFVFKSTDGGATWPIKTYAFGGDKQWMVADQRASGLGAGNIYQSWVHYFSCCGDADFTRSGDGGLSFTSAAAMPDPRAIHGTLATGPDGTLYIAGRDGTSGIGHVFGRIHAQDIEGFVVFEPLIPIDLGGETPYHEGPNPGGIVGQIWIAAHPVEFGKVYVLATIDPPGADPAEVMFISSTDNGDTWSAPVRVNDDPLTTNAWQWFATMSVAPNGRIDAVWNDTRVTGVTNQSALFYSYSLDGGETWSVNEQVSPVFDSWIGWPNQNKIGDYYHMVSDDDGASLAYSATFKGGQDVYYLRLTRDCDGNDIADDCDLACGEPGTVCDVAGCGLADDCNGNFIPDACDIAADPALDCNDNMAIDECDIASGTSQDADGNGIPDECCPLPCAPTPMPEPAAMGKNRFVSFLVPPPGEPHPMVLRVRLSVLHDTPVPPDAPDFSAFEGQYRYVNTYRDGLGNVVWDCPDSALLGNSFKCATLGCQPEYRDWAGDLAGATLHLSGSAVVPSSTLTIAHLPPYCQGFETDCPSASAELMVATRRWGDIVDAAGVPVNAIDIAAVVDKVKDLASAVSEPRALLQPKVPTPLSSAVNAQDIGRSVDAVKGLAYPFAIDPCP